MIKKPLISVVMPIYNVEDYLREAIDSVVNQDIGFEKNIELILVNDGSPDDCESICLEYKEQYPHNIVYIKQKNQGVSAARYNGLLRAKGEYVHFMDSDDKLSSNFYTEGISFLRKNKKDINFVASKLIFFEAKRGGHYLNYRFKKTRVINIDQEPRAFQYHMSSVIIRRNSLRKDWFDKKLLIGEDARIMAMLLKEKRAYGVVSNTIYHYRIREAENSAINTQRTKRDYYTETPKLFWEYVLNAWTSKDGSLPKYIQHFILNDIQWRINEQKSQHVLLPSEEKVYKSHIYKIISRLDDDVILGAERLDMYKKVFLLRKKHGDISDIVKYSPSKKSYCIDDVDMMRVDNGSYFGVVIDFIKPLGNNRFLIEGYTVNDPLHKDDTFAFRTSLGAFKLKYVERSQRKDDAFLGDSFRALEAFEVTIEVGDRDSVEVVMNIYNGAVLAVPSILKRNARIGNIRGSYRQFGEITIRREKTKLGVYSNISKQKRIFFELFLWLSISKNIRVRAGLELLKKSVRSASKRRAIAKFMVGVVHAPLFIIRNILLNVQSILLRILLHMGVARQELPIWLISDRGMAAGDNGEAFFRYLMSQDNLPVKAFFVINRRSKDYKRIKSIGSVVALGGFRYKLLFLRSSKIISSHADEYVINPFGMREPQLVDLLSFDFIFLQHGIIKNDMSDWLNRYSKDIKLFVTTSKRERQSILEYPFYYSDKEVKLTGLPRYDYLKNDPKRKIILMPTWRKYLTNGAVGKDGAWGYHREFKTSEYFSFFNNLINDDRLLSIMKENNVVGEFYLHPSHAKQIKDFKDNAVFKIMDFPYDYKKALAEGSLLITDYSSVYFDFSYLKKPVMYTQFDKDYYYQNHDVYNRGYFDEERDGFGPVVEDNETAIDEVEKIIKSGFSVDKKYLKRIQDFFNFYDKNNSKRVYEAILGMSEAEKNETNI